MRMRVFLYILLLIGANPATAAEPVILSLDQFKNLSTTTTGEVIELRAYLLDANLILCSPCPPDVYCDYCPPPILRVAENAKSSDIVEIRLNAIAPDIKLEKDKTYIFRLKRHRLEIKTRYSYIYELLSAQAP